MWSCVLACLFLILCDGAAAQSAGGTGKGVELVTPLTIGKRVLEGKVVPSDITGMLDERADNLQRLLLAPPDPSPYPENNFNEWMPVTTCREWMRLHAAGWFAYDTVDQGSDAEFLQACGTVSALETAQAATASFLPKGGLGDIRFYSPLLLAAFATEDEDRNHALAAGGRSFGDLERNKKLSISVAEDSPERYFEGHESASDHILVILRRESSENAITYFFAGYENTLRLIARGDFNRDGVEDFLVFFAFSGAGTATDAELLILSRQTDSATIEPVACVLGYKPCELGPELGHLSGDSRP